jgi:hypothetical protein
LLILNLKNFMNKLSKVLIVTTLLTSLSSCVGTGVSSGPGFLFTSAKEGVMAVNNQRTDRTGTSCGQTVLGIVAFGDSSVQSAKQSANIQNVATIDRDYFSILGLYGKSCLIVSGN